MEFTVNGVDYRAAKLDAFAQLKVTRKLLPVMAGMVSEIESIRSVLPQVRAAGGVSGIPLDQVSVFLENVLPKVADVLADMPEESVNAIIHPCLSVVSRKSHAGNWTAVFSQGALMFDDINLVAMLQIVARVVADSLGNILPALPGTEIAGQQSGQATA